MKTKHSQGEWKPTFNSVKQRGVRAIGGFICVIPKPTHYEGQNQRYENELIEANANAKLIAQSPVMYTFIVDYIDAMEDKGKGKLTIHDTALLESAQQILKQLS